MSAPLLEVDHVTKEFGMGGLLSRQHIRAVDDVSFTLHAGTPEIFTIIGESGSGKTTLARMILGLERPTAGALRFRGELISRPMSRRQRLAFMAAVQPVFQNPFEAFNPLKQVDRYLYATASRFLDAPDRSAVEAAADAALVKVGLSLVEVRGRFPHELSGGQLQRVAIARALIPNPPLLITDEPVSMVDASLRMSIVNLLRSLRDDHGVTVIYITHDLATAYYISDRIVIMQKGKVVETGPARAVLDAPEHPYSRLLKASVLSAEDAGAGKLGPATELATLSDRLLGTGDSHLEQRQDGRAVRVYPQLPAA
jgi:ABC-type oligopeptide transport system ATPase subunit